MFEVKPEIASLFFKEAGEPPIKETGGIIKMSNAARFWKDFKIWVGKTVPVQVALKVHMSLIMSWDLGGERHTYFKIR